MVAAALAVGGGAVSVWSASTTAPAAPVDESPVLPWQEQRRPRPEGFRPEGGGPMRPPGGWWRGDNNPMNRPVSAEEWVYVDRFMKNFSPIRWIKFNDLPENDKKQKLKNAIAVRYRAMQELKGNDSGLYDLRLKRLRVEDEIFDVGWKLNHPDAAKSPTTAPTTQPTPEEMRSHLRELVRDLVRNRIEERRMRVAQLKERLGNEQNRLDQEQSNEERAIEAGMTAIQKQRWPGMNEMVPPGSLIPANASEQK